MAGDVRRGSPRGTHRPDRFLGVFAECVVLPAAAALAGRTAEQALGLAVNRPTALKPL